MTEAKRAGRTATFLGGFWCTGLLALYFINTQLLNQRRFLLLPVFSLLALYLVIGGAIQWKTGRGGIKSKATRLTPLATAMVQVILFIILAVLQYWSMAD